MTNLRDFRYFFNDTNEVKTFIEEINGVAKEDLGVMISRARQAWNGLKDAIEVQDGKRSRSDEADLDTPLAPEILRDKNVFSGPGTRFSCPQSCIHVMR